jgi:calcineurin-like phosphoesterase family protein
MEFTDEPPSAREGDAMLNFEELNKTWTAALRAHALTTIEGKDGPCRALNDRSLELLDRLWAGRVELPDLGAMIEASKQVHFWSDPHIGHDNIRHLAPRPEFVSVEEMDRVIWENVEDAARASDFLLCTGDLALKDENPLHFQRRLNEAFGSKQLTIVGNHDAKGAKPDEWIAAGGVAASLAFSLPTALIKSWLDEDHASSPVHWDRLPSRVNFGCAHWPVPVDRMPGPSWLNIHGHSHRRMAGPLHVNCSVEAIDYRPKTLRELVTPELLGRLVMRERGIEQLASSSR